MKGDVIKTLLKVSDMANEYDLDLISKNFQVLRRKLEGSTRSAAKMHLTRWGTKNYSSILMAVSTWNKPSLR